MRTMILTVVAAALGCETCFAESPWPTFKTLQLTDKFYCEGAYYADFNKDGHLDVVSGPYWYEGPDFQKKHEIYPPKAFDPKEYSDVFGTFAGDFNGDGWPDVLYVPFPGGDAYWFENPAGKERPWKKHLALKDVGNESPMWADINGDGRPELIYNETGRLGFATYDPAKPDQPWVFHPITPRRDYYQRFTHGIGYGDINGDGRIDLVESAGWWEQPATPKPGEPWIWHPFKFAEAAAQMLICDVNGDGLNDVITAWNCHGYGLLWYQQTRNNNGKIGWREHVILPPNPDPKSSIPRFSQLHALTLAEIKGDRHKRIVTGKRFWAHGPEGDVEPNAPAVVYWFEPRPIKPIKEHSRVAFDPHLIDDNSGVGTQVTAVDLNGDGIDDIIVGNKKGTFVFLSQPSK
jgi:FG-GAP-like repeat/FG-GAP repeat